MNTFTPFHSLHLAMLAVIALLTGAAVRGGVRSTAGRQRAECAFALLTLALWFVNCAERALARPFDPGSAFPLALCQLAALTVPIALLKPRRICFALLYFWGLGLSAQGLITPVLHDGPARAEFWFFWYGHGAIVGTAVYVVVVHGFRPTWRDWRGAVAAGLTYVAVVFSIDVRFGLNYGFLGNELPDQPSVLDLFGPWPMRVVVMSVVTIAIFAALQAPWALARRAPTRGPPSAWTRRGRAWRDGSCSIPSSSASSASPPRRAG